MNITSYDAPYSAADHQTWRSFFQAIEKTWATYGGLIHPFYMANVEVLRRYSERIPTLAEINEMLAPIGWTATLVDGLAPPWEIARWLDLQVLPVSRRIRSPCEIYFANGPDLIHDFFGHIPLLFSQEYRSLLRQWSSAASHVEISEMDHVNFHLNKLIVQSQDHVAPLVMSHLKSAANGLDQFIAHKPSPSLVFDKIYFWIFEFGIIECLGQKLIMGAGLLSSLSEIENMAIRPVKTALLDQTSVFSTYNISTQQDAYLVAPDLQHYQALMAAMITGDDHEALRNGIEVKKRA
jgi:phenylalanine-4-hydroxylase